MAKIFAAIIGMSTGRRQVPAVAKGENEQAADSDGPLVVSLVTEQQLGMAATDSHWTMAQVLAYWHAVEMFDPHGIPRPLRREALDREPGTRCVEALKLEAGQPLPVLPWQPEHPRHGEAPRPSTYGSTWRHTVYGGVYSFQVIRAALAKALRYEEEEDYGGRNKDAEGALFAVTVDGHEAGQSETGQPEAAQPVSSEAGTRRSLQLPDLVAFAAYVADILRLPASLADYSALRIESVPVSRKKDGSLPDPKPAFLSSLIAPDLRRVAAGPPLPAGRPASSTSTSGTARSHCSPAWTSRPGRYSPPPPGPRASSRSWTSSARS
jgi:hypothetical protein